VYGDADDYSVETAVQLLILAYPYGLRLVSALEIVRAGMLRIGEPLSPVTSDVSAE